MKVAILSSHTPSVFWFRLTMVKEFIKRGCEVVVLANEDEALWRDKFAESGISYRQIDVSRNGTNPLGDLKTYRSIKEALKRENPDKIFTFQAKTVIYGSLAAKKYGIEVFPLIAGMGSVYIGEGLKNKLVRAVLNAEYRAALKHAKSVFFQNGDDLGMFSDLNIIDKSKAVMIHGSGVDVKRFAPQGLPDDAAFLYIGRLIRDKGVGEYLDACLKVKAEYPNTRCLLVGPFDTNPSSLAKDELQKYIDAGVEYFGEQEDVRPFIAQSSVLVLPSYREGTPKTVLEAMSMGRAIITTDAPGCRETTVDGENGYLVPVKDAGAVAEKMRIFIENPALAASMGKKGRERAVELFDVDKVNNVICKTMNI